MTSLFSSNIAHRSALKAWATSSSRQSRRFTIMSINSLKSMAPLALVSTFLQNKSFHTDIELSSLNVGGLGEAELIFNVCCIERTEAWTETRTRRQRAMEPHTLITKLSGIFECGIMVFFI